MKNIILIGFMGCGKSSVGKRLAERLGCPFLDTDEWIEQKQQKSIPEIFAQEGESAFREMETDCLRELQKAENQGYVLSVGGGLPIRENNRRLLKQLGTVVWLQVGAETVYKRLRGDTTRPLLRDKNPRGRIADLMGARKSFYEDAAECVVHVDNKEFEEIIEEILKIQNTL